MVKSFESLFCGSFWVKVAQFKLGALFDILKLVQSARRIFKIMLIRFSPNLNFTVSPFWFWENKIKRKSTKNDKNSRKILK